MPSGGSGDAVESSRTRSRSAASDARATTPEPAAAAGPAVDDVIAALCDTATLLYDRGWAFGTSGNYSVVIDRQPLRLLITASGRDKRRLGVGDFLLVGESGSPIEWHDSRPSAETMLHVALTSRRGVGSVLHTHSVWNTVLSERHAGSGALRIAGYEMLKGLAGIDTHDTAIEIPIFNNTQDIPALADRLVRELNPEPSPPHAFLIRGHGLYTWGRDLNEARRHVEILEFLFEVVGRRTALAG